MQSRKKICNVRSHYSFDSLLTITYRSAVGSWSLSLGGGDELYYRFFFSSFRQLLVSRERERGKNILDQPRVFPFLSDNPFLSQEGIIGFIGYISHSLVWMQMGVFAASRPFLPLLKHTHGLCWSEQVESKWKRAFDAARRAARSGFFRSVVIAGTFLLPLIINSWKQHTHTTLVRWFLSQSVVSDAVRTLDFSLTVFIAIRSDCCPGCLKLFTFGIYFPWSRGGSSTLEFVYFRKPS